MTALQQQLPNELSFIIQESDKNELSNGAQIRNKKRILDHIKNGVDVILVTSAKLASEPFSLESYFSDNQDEIRTLTLNCQSIDPQAIDLSMISAVVYESIHLDTHFAIIVNNADQLPIEQLNELIQLALGVNTSKNNVNFIFSGEPLLLSIIDRLSDIKRLSLAHCSFDELTQDELNDFINTKQSHLGEQLKLTFNKHAIKKICSLANGSLLTASALLEWIRLYSQHTNNNKVTVGMINELSNAVDSTSMLTSYPPHDYQFGLTKQPDNENVEFKKHDSTLSPNVSSTTSDEVPSENKTIYIELSQAPGSENSTDTNVFEKVMHDSGELETNTPETVNTEFIDSKTEQLHDNVDTDENEYTDLYHLESLKHINDPLPDTPDDLTIDSDDSLSTQTPETINVHNEHNNTNRLVVFLVAVILIVVAGYYSWASGIFDYSVINPTINKIKANAPITQNTLETESLENNNTNAQTKISETENPSLTSNPNPDYLSDKTIASMLDRGHRQIENKKLTTPANDNAFDTFNEVLELQPNNQQALEGIEKIKSRYLTWANLDIEEGKIKRAKYFLKRAIYVAPHDQTIKQRLENIEQTNILAHQ